MTLFVFALWMAGTTQAADFIIIPESVSLTGAHARQRLLAERVEDGEFLGQVGGQVRFESGDANIVRVEADTLIPLADGATVVRAQHSGQTTEIRVEVSQMQRQPQWSFRNHLQSVLYKAGCSTGACHGALAGQGGFKLSLRGYNTARDHFAITREARGRRIELADPGRSLILAKPSGAIPHRGGLRFEVDSLEYRVLSQWIASGAPAPRNDDPRLGRLEVLPGKVTLKKGEEQQLLLRAHFTDGRVEDVTHWAKFTATNEAVAKVGESGKVTVIGSGEAAVTAWYLNQIVVARVVAPYKNEIPASVFANAPRRNFIDELVLEKLHSLRLPPSARAGDGEFLRRAYLDTIGTLPTADEVGEYLAEGAADRRDRLIDDLLTRPEYVDYWTYRWSDVLLVNGRRLRPATVKAYYTWIREQVESNTPWDEFARRIVTARGSSTENGATNFYALHQSPEEMSENISQTFLGLSIACAKCHNHPLEKWTNDQYYGMANLFARVRAKGWGGDPRSGDGRRTLYVATSGELLQPLTGKPQSPRPLDGEAVPFEATEDRRQHLAAWLTAADNPYFSRAIANRVWGNFFGVGLVESVDDMRKSNPPSNAKLLGALSEFLIKNEYNLKTLMRVILQSETYQRTSRPLEGNQSDGRHYARYYPRRLMAEVLLDAISQVTDVPAEFNQIGFPGADFQKTDAYPKGTRAIQLHDAAVVSYFLKTFGRNPREITCECERSNKPSIVQTLHVANGDTVNSRLRAEDGVVSKLLSGKMSNDQVIEEVYLRALARRPVDEEKSGLLAMFAEAGEAGRREVLEDLLAAIFSSREFQFNH
ncbi:MAG: DUF1553 domain-containing protein [Pirellulales bacterium]